MTCAFCGKPAEGNAAIHRDGFGIGPEVDLCDACGTHETPTCEEIWDRIAEPSESTLACRRAPAKVVNIRGDRHDP